MTPLVVEVPWDHPDATALRAALDAELALRYADRLGDDGVAQALAVERDDVGYTALALADGVAVGHLALRPHGDDMEIKRVYVTPAARGTGVAAALLAAAETVAWQRGAARLVLQTGDRQPDAVGMYRKAGYSPIAPFPPYDALPFSVCLAKTAPSIPPATTPPATDPPVTTPGGGATTPPRC